jgi:hypothetical protein
MMTMIVAEHLTTSQVHAQKTLREFARVHVADADIVHSPWATGGTLFA